MLSVKVIVVGIIISDPSSIPGWNCISLYVNAFGKGIDPCVLPQVNVIKLI